MIELIIDMYAQDCNGLLDLKILDQHGAQIQKPTLIKGKNSIMLNIDLPNYLYFVLSGKNHKYDTKIDPNTEKVIQDKSLQITDVKIDKKSLNKNRVAKMFNLKSESNGVIKSSYWGFNGVVEFDLNYKDSLEMHLKHLE